MAKDRTSTMKSHSERGIRPAARVFTRALRAALRGAEHAQDMRTGTPGVAVIEVIDDRVQITVRLYDERRWGRRAYWLIKGGCPWKGGEMVFAPITAESPANARARQQRQRQERAEQRRARNAGSEEG